MDRMTEALLKAWRMRRGTYLRSTERRSRMTGAVVAVVVLLMALYFGIGVVMIVLGK